MHAGRDKVMEAGGVIGIWATSSQHLPVPQNLLSLISHVPLPFDNGVFAQHTQLHSFVGETILSL